MEDWQHGGFGLYIHWPFCAAKCPYCDFNSHVRATIDQSRWERAFLQELDRMAQTTSDRVLDTVFFGGGTPSLMDPDLVAALLAKIRSTWRRSNSFEVSLEANPTSVEAGRFRAYADAGVNRISMGVQALNDDDLRALGRLHSAADAKAAFDIAKAAFDRVSFDLIYARQRQSLDAWKAELREALSMSVDHLSLYQLTIEPGTVFGARAKVGHLKGLPTDDLGADMYEATQEICEEAGFPAYEVSNHAREGSESRHNLIYWRCGDYLGIGPGAHGRVTEHGQRWATETLLSPEAWLEQVETTGSGTSNRTVVSTEEQAIETLMMGLRLKEGVSLQRLRSFEGFVPDRDQIAFLIEQSLIKVENDRICATSEGMIVLNSVIAALVESAT